MQYAGKIARMLARRFFQGRTNSGEFMGKHVLKQRRLARKISVERLLTDGQFNGQIVHGHPAESVTQKVCPGRVHDPLANRVSRSSLFP